MTSRVILPSNDTQSISLVNMAIHFFLFLNTVYKIRPLKYHTHNLHAQKEFLIDSLFGQTRIITMFICSLLFITRLHYNSKNRK